MRWWHNVCDPKMRSRVLGRSERAWRDSPGESMSMARYLEIYVRPVPVYQRE